MAQLIPNPNLYNMNDQHNELNAPEEPDLSKVKTLEEVRAMKKRLVELKKFELAAELRDIEKKLVKEQESRSVLESFYPVVANVVDEIRGFFSKEDLDGVDPIEFEKQLEALNKATDLEKPTEKIESWVEKFKHRSMLVKIIENGPALLSSENEPIVVDEVGGGILIKNKVAICRCGRTGKPPYCDGTHKNEKGKEDLAEYKAGDIIKEVGVANWTIIDNVTVDEDGTLYHLRNKHIVSYSQIQEKLDPVMD